MSQTASQNKEYFLGIGGEQQGPFTEQDILQKIGDQSLPPDALIWYEGLDSWLPVDNIPIFRDAMASDAQINTPVNDIPPPPPAANAIPSSTPARRAPAALNRRPVNDYDDAVPESTQSTFAPADSDGEAVFGKKDARISKLQPWETRNGLIGLIGGGCILTFVLFSWALNSGKVQIEGIGGTKKELPPKVTRETQLRKAMSELIIKSKESLSTLKALVKENPADPVGKEALEVSVEYYRRNRKPEAAGQLLMEANQPAEAAKYFLMEPPNFPSASQAHFRAYEMETSPGPKAQHLLDHIGLLLGPINQKDKAVERLQLFVKEFPAVNHPYGYYLKTQENQIKDIFGRLTFYFADQLSKQLTTQFPEVFLVGKPRVSLVKNSNGTFRVQADYKGEVDLNRDRLKDVYLNFWLAQERWQLVNTNLTPQRQKWANEEKKKTNAGMNPNVMLSYLESLFKTKFPKSALHEIVADQKAN